MSRASAKEVKEEEEANRDREVSLEAKIRQELIQSGERDRFKRLLREKLTECGWRDDIKQRCREFLQGRGGREDGAAGGANAAAGVTAEDVARALRQEGRAAVPDSVKAELLAQIRAFMVKL